ncbi:protein-methionine-sulfoxide reductase heme-binding subunit MsrQ [Tabrizicola aquatica]|uniref:protein-methionine-sulfoxide reductase heme-binding subunit MsrQ n=1 Tax=Tabrizicola aquatica TaxID=909926 RepID=UPI000CD02B60|nr:protein-methionine-sulfoxide reductase heme-binding subunit MsrQ [Tabrizicola aquatica]
MDRLNGLARRLPTWVVYVLGAVPLAFLVWGALTGGLGVEPVKAIEHRLGELGLQFLLGSLAITPLRRVGLNLIRFRRALGLLAFFYIALHLVAWVWLDMGLRWTEMAADLVKRPYVILGMLGFVAMIPLAATSTNAAIRRLGPVAWGRLHRLAYVAILAGLAHLVLLSKVWTAEVLAYSVLGLALLALRLLPRRKARASQVS